MIDLSGKMIVSCMFVIGYLVNNNVSIQMCVFILIELGFIEIKLKYQNVEFYEDDEYLLEQ